MSVHDKSTICPTWTILHRENVIPATHLLFTMQEYQYSLSTMGVISTSPSLSLKYTKFPLDKAFVIIYVIFSSVEMY
jgi:hypothetical protein